MKISDIEGKASTLLHDFLKRADANHDGDISKQEFKSILAQAIGKLAIGRSAIGRSGPGR